MSLLSPPKQVSSIEAKVVILGSQGNSTVIQVLDFLSGVSDPTNVSCGVN